MTPKEARFYLAQLNLFEINLFWLHYCEGVRYKDLEKRISQIPIPPENGFKSYSYIDDEMLRVRYMPDIRLKLGLNRKFEHINIRQEAKFICKTILELEKSHEVEIDRDKKVITKTNISQNLFPRNKKINSTEFFPQFIRFNTFIGAADPLENIDYFSCEVLNLPNAQKKAIKFIFQKSEIYNNFGYFGIGPLFGFDASLYKSICLSVYCETQKQNFWLNIKDLDGREGRELIPININLEEEPICISLDTYIENHHVNISQLENINIGFDNISGSSEIWLVKLLLQK